MGTEKNHRADYTALKGHVKYQIRGKKKKLWKMPIFKGLEKKREVKNWGLKKKMGAKIVIADIFE